MCRFTLYLGPTIRLSSLVVEPKHSIIQQSFRSTGQDDPLNGDGFGIAWYVHELSPEPALFRSVTPAWNNDNLLELAKVVKSHVILAHVRAASKHGGQSEANCHPFRWGRYAFMHNGDIGDFVKLRRPLLQTLSDAAFAVVQGNTDSEHLFALVVDELMKGQANGLDAMAQAMANAVRRVVELGRDYGIGEPHYLNLALSDGTDAVAVRYTTHEGYDGESLFVHTGRIYVCSNGECRMLAPDKGKGCVLVSSEPLSEDQGWDPIPRNALVRIDRDGAVAVQKLDD